MNIQRLFLLALLHLFCGHLLAQGTARPAERKIMFACPPCGCAGDTVFAEHAGVCADCGAPFYPIFADMENVNRNLPEQPKTVAILLFPGVELIDFTGPWEVLAASGMQVFSVAGTDTAFSCFPGLNVRPDYTFANCPQPDILLVPGGGVDPKDSVTVHWIRSMSQKTERTVSVCTGAYMLAAAGLLDRQDATTFFLAIPDFKSNFPTVHVIDDARFVDNGHVITSAGLTSGIDLAFHIVALYQGEAEAQQLANLLEYNWTRESDFARGKLADRYLVDFLQLMYPFEHRITRYDGDELRWNLEIHCTTDIALSELERLLGFQASLQNGWRPTKHSNTWAFKDRGHSWTVSFSINNAQDHGYNLNIAAKALK